MNYFKRIKLEIILRFFDRKSLDYVQNTNLSMEKILKQVKVLNHSDKIFYQRFFNKKNSNNQQFFLFISLKTLFMLLQINAS